MAWIYLVESEGSVSHSANGVLQSPIVKTTDMLKLCCCREWLMGDWQELQSGTTLHRSEGPCYQLPSTSSTAASPAKTSVLQVVESAWVESEADYSSTSQGLSVKQTRDLYFSKTSQQLELVASIVSCKHLPSSGMIVGGQLYRPQKLVPSTFASDGSYLPTPTASDYGKNNGRNSKDPMKSRDQYSLSMLWKKGLIPTITVSQKTYDRQKNGHITKSLSKLWSETTGTKLPPSFSEMIMGYQIGWTAINVSVTQLFQSKRKLRSKDCAV